MSIEGFHVAIPQDDIDFLTMKLKLTRPSPTVDDPDWALGMPSAYVEKLRQHWLGFDWRNVERKINGFRNFTTEYEGGSLHFVHELSPRTDAMPLLLIHGWPGSFMEFLDVIKPLTKSDASHPAFHIVCPSLPGFGFSTRLGASPFNTTRMAKVFVDLMTALGYEKFHVQGGDWGSGIASQIARMYPERCLGLHINLIGVPPPADARQAQAELAPHEGNWLAQNATTNQEGMGYFAIQSTRPQTLAHALNDSPIGLAAWIGEKFIGWSDRHGDGSSLISLDTIVAHAALYWFTQSIGTSMRIYYDEFHAPQVPEFVSVPTGVAIFPKEIIKAPKRWAQRHFNIIHWQVHDRGGHFAALEVPELLVGDIRSFVARAN